jgi:hypothetical protein
MEPVKYQLTKSEFAITSARRFWCRKKMLFLHSLVLLIFFVCLIPNPPLYSTAIFLLAYFIFIPIIHLGILYKLAIAHPDLFTSEKTLIIGDDGIKVITTNLSSNVSWSAYKKWTEDNKYIFLHYDNVQAAFVPKRAFTSEQLMEFKTLLAEKTQPA